MNFTKGFSCLIELRDINFLEQLHKFNFNLIQLLLKVNNLESVFINTNS
jgi:hypothetical protein